MGLHDVKLVMSLPDTSALTRGSIHTAITRWPVVLAFTDFYMPGFRGGGPIRTLAGVVDRLGDEIDFRIITLDRDLGEEHAYNNVNLQDWNTIGQAQVRYLSRHAVSFHSLGALIRTVNPDLIYLNSFFSPLFTQRVLWLRRFGRLDAIPIILAPRGEFSTGALSIKRWKKRIFMGVSRQLGIYRGLIWQASSSLERDDIHRELSFVPKRAVHIAMNLAPHAHDGNGGMKARQFGDPLRICFLSRISPMKNLEYGLRCVSAARADVKFTIYGPKEDLPYWAECERFISTMPARVSVVYAGELKHDKVREMLHEHDLFLLPTRGENYGHVIHEALAAGLPVLISDQTPWLGLRERGVGWALPLAQPERFTEVIEEVAKMPADQMLSMRRRAIAYAREKSEDPAVLEANRALFMNALKRN